MLMLNVLVVLLCSISCNQEISPRNKIVFEDNVDVVADSIKQMDELLYKFPKNEQINYFMDNEGSLYVNNEKLGSLVGAINNTEIRNHKVFKNFANEEINDFFNLMAFLLYNHIDGAVMELSIQKFVYGYRKTPENRFDDLREIVILDGANNTLSGDFKKIYKVLDEKSNLALIAPLGVE